jgi:hypothetical protein
MGMPRGRVGPFVSPNALTGLSAALLALSAPGAAAQVGATGDAQKQLEKQMRQYDAAWRLEVPEEAEISERLLLDFGASARAGLYSIDDAESKSHVLREYDGRAWLRADLDGVHRFYGRLKFTYDDWNEGDDFDGQGDDLREPIGERWWYEFNLRGHHQATTGETTPWHVDLKAGKQFVQFGSGLALSSALIAGQLELEAYGVALDLLLGKTPPNDVVDWDASRPSFDSNTKRSFYGGLLEVRGGGCVPYVYGLVQRDHNDRDFSFYTDATSQLFPTNFAYDSEYFGGGFHGTLDPQWAYQSEFSLETGRALSSPIGANGAPVTQTEERVHAWAAEVELAWLARDARHTRCDLECIVGSGDGDRLDSADTFGGNLTGTTDTAYNSLGFAQTGLALTPDPSNLITTRLGTATSPFVGRGDALDRLRLLVDGYAFVKLDPSAPISVPTDHHRYAGTELDLGVDWALVSDVTLNLRAGLFLPGSAMPTGENGLRKFLYGSVTYVF